MRSHGATAHRRLKVIASIFPSSNVTVSAPPATTAGTDHASSPGSPFSAVTMSRMPERDDVMRPINSVGSSVTAAVECAVVRIGTA